MHHAPDTARRCGLDRGGHTADVDAHDGDGIGNLAGRTSGDRGKIEDAIDVTPAQRGLQALGIADVPRDLPELAGRVPNRGPGYWRTGSGSKAIDLSPTPHRASVTGQAMKPRAPR